MAFPSTRQLQRGDDHIGPIALLATIPQVCYMGAEPIEQGIVENEASIQIASYSGCRRGKKPL